MLSVSGAFRNTPFQPFSAVRVMDWSIFGESGSEVRPFRRTVTLSGRTPSRFSIYCPLICSPSFQVFRTETTLGTMPTRVYA